MSTRPWHSLARPTAMRWRDTLHQLLISARPAPIDELVRHANDSAEDWQPKLRERDVERLFVDHLAPSRILRPLALGEYEIFLHTLRKPLGDWVRRQQRLDELPKKIELAEEMFARSQLDGLRQAAEAASFALQEIQRHKVSAREVPTPLLIGSLKRMLNEVVESRRITDPDSPLNSMSYSPDGKWFAAASFNGRVHLLNRENGREEKPIEDPDGSVLDVTLGPYERVALASGHGYARILDFKGKVLKQFPKEPATYPCYSAAFSADGTRLATGSMDGVARIWDIDGDQCIEVPRPRVNDPLRGLLSDTTDPSHGVMGRHRPPLERRYGKPDPCLPGRRKAHISRLYQPARRSGGYRLLVRRTGAHLESRRQEAFARIGNPQEIRLPHLLPRSGRTTGGHCILGRHRAASGTWRKSQRPRRRGSSGFWCGHPGICGPSYWARAVFLGIRTYPRKNQRRAITSSPVRCLARASVQTDVSLRRTNGMVLFTCGTWSNRRKRRGRKTRRPFFRPQAPKCVRPSAQTATKLPWPGSTRRSGFTLLEVIRSTRAE